jgi:hypothetical protein
MGRWGFALIVGALAVVPACMTTGMYRTAHVLPKGEGDFSMSFSLVRVTMENPLKDLGSGGTGGTMPGSGGSTSSSSLNSDTLTFTYPNLIPELSYHYGAATDVEVGGRIALGAGMIELDAKYRFLGDDGSRLHMALAPSAGYRTLGIAEGEHASVPLILTYDLNDDVSFNTAGFGSFSHFASTNRTGSDNANFSGNTVVAGGAVGIDIRSMTGFHFMPAVEVQRSLSHRGDLEELPKYTIVLFGVTMGWGPNRRLERIEQKLDKIDQKIDLLKK